MVEQVGRSLAEEDIAVVARNPVARIVAGVVLRKVAELVERHIGQEGAQEVVLRIGLAEELEIRTVGVAELLIYQ